MNSRHVNFAIGSFHFGLKKVYPGGMTGEDYLKELSESLEGISNINNIHISRSEDFDSQSIQGTGQFTPLDEGDDFFPQPSNYPNISFDIYIPKRLQVELFPPAESALHTERFRVHLREGFYFPVTFVELNRANNQSEPSAAVAVIREFLEQQFAEKKPEYVRFEFLGPSPFHADFLLAKGNDKPKAYDSNGFSINCPPQKGYNKFEIHYSGQYFSSFQDAKETLFSLLLEEASIFYRTVHYDVLQINAWGNIQDLLNRLIETNKMKGLKAIWFQNFRLSQQVQEMVFALSEFEGNRILTPFFVKKMHQDLTKDGKKPYLQDVLQEELGRFQDYPVSQMKDIIELFESRRSKRIDNLVVLTASIIGGIIGAVITMLVAR